MAGSEHHYQVLGLKPGATADEIKRAYRDLASEWHPDRFAKTPHLRQLAEQKMREINAAYASLQKASHAENVRERTDEKGSRQKRAAYGERGGRDDFHPPERRWQGPEKPVCAALAPDGSTARVGGRGLYAWDSKTGSERRDLRIDRGEITGLAASPCGRYLVYGVSLTIFGAAERREIRLCDADSGKERVRLRGLRGRLIAADFSPNGDEVAGGDSAGELSIWNSAHGQRLRQFPVANAPGGVHRVAFCNGADRLVTLHRGEVQEQISLWNAHTGVLVRELTVHIRDSRRYGQIQDIAPSPDGRWLLVANNDPLRRTWSLHLWDTSADREVRDFTGHEGRINRIEIAPDGRWGLSAGDDRIVRIWDIETGAEIGRLTGAERALTTVTLSRNGNQILGAGSDGSAYLWRVPPGLQQRIKNR